MDYDAQPAPSNYAWYHFTFTAHFAGRLADGLQFFYRLRWEIRMFSFDLNRIVSFPRYGGTNLTPPSVA